MPEYFQRPENALRKAHEFLDVGKLKPALDVLIDVLRSKKHRTWQKIHEPIIRQYLELCVELRKSQAAKEGLYQYKLICQQVNTKSLEDAVTHYLDLAEAKTREAREKSAETALKMVEDLDMIESPEGMLLRAVTGEVTQDRTDRLLLTPWVKYLWESYRQCLDLLRNNNRVEKLYHNIAQKAFKFCLNYDRRTEFRKLCDNLRNHVKLSEQRLGTQNFSVNLSNPETQALHLETRIAQLDAAIQIELWQEAFKAVEDIHYLMNLSKRPPKPQTLANFNNKLSLVFWKAENMLFHACTRHRLFHLTKDMKKNPSMDDLARMASIMLVSTLSIPITEQKHGIGKLLDMEGALIEKHLNLSKLLSLERPPTRASLIQDFLKFNLLQYVPRQLRDLYQWLEVDFHPLLLNQKISGVISWIQEQTREPELKQYVPYIQNIVVSKVLQQVSEVYQTIKFTRLQGLLPFYSPFQLERTIVDAARNGQLQVRIDHTKGSLSFGTDLNASPLYVEDEFFEANRLQALPSERVSDHFNAMSRALLVANNKLFGKKEEIEINKQQQVVLSQYLKTYRKDHQAVLQRKRIIELRKENLENLNLEKEQKEQQAVMKQEEAVKVAEQQRLEKEQKERAALRRKEQEREEKRRNASDRLEMIRKSDIGKKMFQDIDINDFDQINPDELMKRQMEKMEVEKRGIQDRLKAQEKKVDFFERAKRLKEIPLLQAANEEKKVVDAKLWDDMEEERIATLKRDQSQALNHKKRMKRMAEDRDAFLQHLCQTRQAVYEEKMDKFEALLSAERTSRLQKRREQRKEERRRKWLQEKEEVEQRRKDEELKKQKEEEDKRKEEAEAAEKKAVEDRMRALSEQEARQRMRELEIEAKLESQRNSRYEPRKEAAWGPRGGGREEEGSWRSRKEERTDWGRGDTRPAPSQESWRNKDAPPKDRSPPPQKSVGAWRPRRAQQQSPTRGRFDDERPSPRGYAAGGTPRRDEGRSWRRSPSPRRQSPAGRRSPPSGSTGRRYSPTGRSPPTGRRRSPAGRKSSPTRGTASPGSWRSTAQPKREPGSWKSGSDNNAWRKGGPQQSQGGSAAPPSRGGAWRPSRPRTENAPPAGDEKPPRNRDQKKEGNTDEWTTIQR